MSQGKRKTCLLIAAFPKKLLSTLPFPGALLPVEDAFVMSLASVLVSLLASWALIAALAANIPIIPLGCWVTGLEVGGP